MNMPLNDETPASEDIYPSRTGELARILERKDPVVYAKDNQNRPANRSLVEQYDEQGFLALKNVFTEEEVKSFSREGETLRADPKVMSSGETITEPGSDDVRSVFRVHEISPMFSQLASCSRLAGFAQNLLDDDVYIHQSRINYKPGFRGKEFYWHSDFETWHVEDGMPRMRALSMSIILTENYDCNGPLMLIPGSHRKYLTCEGETPVNHFVKSLKKQEYGVPSEEGLQHLVDESEIVTATGTPGSVIIFDCNIMHGSNGNITPFPRSNVFFVYNAMSNRVVNPFCEQSPRPEYICSRKNIRPIQVTSFGTDHG